MGKSGVTHIFHSGDLYAKEVTITCCFNNVIKIKS